MSLTKATIKHLPLQTCWLLDYDVQDKRMENLIQYLFQGLKANTVPLGAFYAALAHCQFEDAIIITNNFLDLQAKLQAEEHQTLLAKHRFYVLVLTQEQSSPSFVHTPLVNYVQSLDTHLPPHQIKLQLQKELRFIRKKIFNVLISVSRQRLLESKANKSRNFQTSLDFLIHAHYTNPQFTTLELSEMMGVSVRTLERKTFALTGRTPKQYLLEYRLQKAKKSLLTSFKKISVIAKATGFASGSYFSISFYDRFGISPLQFRQGASMSAS
jgi:AraC-like DNA-binding protein